MKQININVWSSQTLPANWAKRQMATDKTVQEQVETNTKAIIAAVRQKGDAALFEFTEKFDKAKLTSLRATKADIDEAYENVTKEQIDALKFMKDKITRYEIQTFNDLKMETEIDSIKIQTVYQPLESVGCYIPGGQAAYPSTLVMTTIPAKVAGVPRIVACSPPNSEGKINPLVLVAADICGVNEVYKVGGAQSIAAMAYGTETIKPVRKIVGPGSRYVTMSKVLVSTDVPIDMPAGPSEVLILADETAESKLVAYDMISQAEHGGDSVAGLITTSTELAKKVKEDLSVLAQKADRADKVLSALEKYSFIITCDSMEKAIELVNEFASEHLEVMTKKPKALAGKLVAGLVLLGPYTPVALSDYGVGTNHVLPTGANAKSYSGLSAVDYTRRVNIVECSKAGLKKAKGNIEILTTAENLPNHNKAIQGRFQK